MPFCVATLSGLAVDEVHGTRRDASARGGQLQQPSTTPPRVLGPETHEPPRVRIFAGTRVARSSSRFPARTPRVKLRRREQHSWLRLVSSLGPHGPAYIADRGGHRCRHAGSHVHSQRAMLLCFRDKEWEGRAGAKLLVERSTGKIQSCLRHKKTSKMVAHLFVVNGFPLCELSPHPDSEKSCARMALDWSEGESKTAQFT